MRPSRCQTAEWSTSGLSRLTSPCLLTRAACKSVVPFRDGAWWFARERTKAGFSAAAPKENRIPARKVCKFEREANRRCALRLLVACPCRPSAAPLAPTDLPPPLRALVPTSLRPQPDRPPDRKLINECKRANVVDKFNKIVHAQLVSPGVNTFLENVSSLSLCSGIRNFSPLPLNRLGRVSVTAAWITREIILPRIVSLSNNFIVFDKIFCFFFFFYLYRFSKKMENVSVTTLGRSYVRGKSSLLLRVGIWILDLNIFVFFKTWETRRSALNSKIWGKERVTAIKIGMIIGKLLYEKIYFFERYCFRVCIYIYSGQI